MVFTLVQAHAVVMILALITFGSTGILFARYGRSIRFGNRRQLCGKAVWFQIHRLLLSLTSILTLLGFFLILVNADGQWIDLGLYGPHLFAHSILGVIIVVCATIQIWLALYRCHPHSRYRFLFNWSHRVTGTLVIILSIPTMFLPILLISTVRPILLPIFSCWIGWIVIIVIALETIEYRQRTRGLVVVNNIPNGQTNLDNPNVNPRPDTEAGINVNVNSQHYNRVKFLLLFVHMLISIILSVLLMVFLCN